MSTESNLRVAVLGGSGYTGAELLRLLLTHSNVTVTAVTSERSAGTAVSDAFLHVRHTDLIFEPLNLKALVKKADLFFLCLPHGKSQDAVAYLHGEGKKVIDLSADYRLKSASLYKAWYKTPHRYASLLKRAVYGMPELSREKIRKASVVANPGCYPVSSILGLAPLVKAGLADTASIIIDSKSGTSGAGRSPAQPFMFCEVNESVKAYAVASHRHIPEIEQELSALCGKKVSIVFTPHLIPMDRGMLSTIYVRIRKAVSPASIRKQYREFYRNEPCVRVLDTGVYPYTKAVKGTNYCDIALFSDTRSGKGQTLVIVSAIDNLLKGASGTAIQNMNIMCGFDETAGLPLSAPCP